jgi:phosphatidylglycerophosphate synthase
MPALPVGVSESPFRESRRELTSVLAPLERRCLIWIAERLPAAVNSDHLTVLALVSIVAAGACYALAPIWPAAPAFVVVCLAANWFGDSLDGTVARVRRQPRPRYGFYVDHVVDAIGAAALLGGLALSGLMTPAVALALLSAYFLLCVEVFLASQTIGTFTMSYFRIGPTELRILLAVGTLALYTHPAPVIAGHAFRLFDVGGVIGAGGLVVTFFRAAFHHTRLLYLAEPRPAAPKAA